MLAQFLNAPRSRLSTEGQKGNKKGKAKARGPGGGRLNLRRGAGDVGGDSTE